MPVFKNEDNGTWYVMARYVNWKGERKQKCKRGFATKKEAQEWERMFQLQNSSDLDMSFEAFTELYIRDVKNRLKENTWLTKEHIIRTKILPFFGKLKINEISTKEIITWQNEMLAYRDEKKKPYSQTYLKTLHNQLSAIEYHGKGRAVSETWIGESIGNYTVVGYDEVNNGKKYSAEFEAYALKDIAQSQFIAVKMEDSYYVFQNDEYAPPNTLGELMDAVNLSEVVELQRFSEGDNTPDSKRFALSSDDYVWEVLSECRNAPFVEDQTWTAGDRSYLSFTITSEALGVYKVALYVTEDGYLWTNAFNWQYLFNIGEDAASRIIHYAKENSTEVEYEPYRNSVAGTIIEITEEYIVVDDSILCKNSTDGITYKVLLNDLRISRYVDYGIVKVGDTVQISYEGEIDKTRGNTIVGAISVFKATISDGDVLIPE